VAFVLAVPLAAVAASTIARWHHGSSFVARGGHDLPPGDPARNDRRTLREVCAGGTAVEACARDEWLRWFGLAAGATGVAARRRVSPCASTRWMDGRPLIRQIPIPASARG
jgi:hypothetical protein